MTDYPYEDGDRVILAPDCYGAKDRTAVNWGGVNYIRGDGDIRWKDVVVGDVVDYGFHGVETVEDLFRLDNDYLKVKFADDPEWYVKSLQLWVMVQRNLDRGKLLG